MIVAWQFIAKDLGRKESVRRDGLIRSTLPPSQPYITKSLHCLYRTVPDGTGPLVHFPRQ
jgi:hypothetical protein